MIMCIYLNAAHQCFVDDSDEGTTYKNDIERKEKGKKKRFMCQPPT